MKDLNYFSKIYLATKPADFRKQAYGLSLLVKQRLNLELFDDKSLFVFINRHRDSIKMLYWDLTGLALWVKNLEKEKFCWLRKVSDPSSAITARELKWLLQGADITKIKSHKKLNFKEVF